MRINILFQIASFALLSLFSCAEVGSPETVSPLAESVISMIPSCLEDAFSSDEALDRCFKEHFPSDSSAKSIFKEHFDIPELVTDDVDENEKELKFLLLSYSMFKNPDDLFNALSIEFYFSENIHVLVTHFLEYLNRVHPCEFDFVEIEILIKHKRFAYLFDHVPNLFEKHNDRFFESDELENFQNLQEYLLTDPERLQHITTYYSSLRYPARFIANWIKVALASNMPDSIFRAFPKFSYDVFEKPCVWSGLSVKEQDYPEMFNRINYLIDNADFGNDFYMDPEVYKEGLRLKTLIRYGPGDLDIYEEKIVNLRISSKVDLCHYAFLANKMELFQKLLPEIMPHIREFPHLLGTRESGSLSTYKFIFEIYHNSSYWLRQFIYDATGFFSVLTKYYRVIGINWKRNSIDIEFRIAVEADISVFPEQLTINRTFSETDNLEYFLSEVIFDNAEALETFLVGFFNEFKLGNYFEKKSSWAPEFILRIFGKRSYRQIERIYINDSNLNLIVRSESIRNLIHQSMENSLIPRRPFSIKWKHLFSIDDEYDSILVEIAKINKPRQNVDLSDFKTTKQLKRLEFHTGLPVSAFLSEFSNYITTRQAFKYVIENHQKLPEKLSEDNRAFMRIDFPSLDI